MGGLVNPWLAQANPVEATVNSTGQFISRVGSYLPNLLGALAILIIGWLVATIISAAIQGLLKRTEFDNRLAGWVSGRQGADNAIPIEKWVGTAVFWLIMAFVIVAFLNALQLSTVSAPLNSFLQQIFDYLPKIAGAAVLAGVAWVVATVAKTIVTRGLSQFNLDDKINRLAGPDQPASRSSEFGDPMAAPPRETLSLNETFGNALYWFVLLFFLPLILGVLDLQGPLAPVQNLLDEILSALPRILNAILIGVVGWFVAKVVRTIVTNFLAAVGTDRVGAQMGLTQSAATGGLSLSALLGTVVYVLILLPTVIAALNALQIEAISAPAVAMLGQILAALPKIFTAALILGVSYVIGRFVADLVAQTLTSVGFNNVFDWLGFSTPPAVRPIAEPPPEPLGQSPLGQSTVIPPSQSSLPRQTPSEIAGLVVLVAIMLTGAVAAVEKLDFAVLTDIVRAILASSANILGGLIVLGIGLYLANLAFTLISRSGGRQTRLLGQAARIAIIAFSVAMALDRMGVASNIVNLAFGLLLGAIAVAIGISFGLGGRGVADDLLRGWLESFKRN
ncbi:MAG: mechanosensitive ion channel [Pegethrix bostrychoides GSE-TBD4-15B]|jgi:TRAP-type mannitol/chloroaromatic compound transport system permease small subunit|uniref:Mechanosensitive ion channel n=1 Tax=Pegethrix bostrychoides GSE-TBD4-15B TaxID=2839662 RepID=A0A951PAC1_9CYAN|nr:mechanosensitive ion channel [Pegethrix bostrychoides GSE-TBD4-15B]